MSWSLLLLLAHLAVAPPGPPVAGPAAADSGGDLAGGAALLASVSDTRRGEIRCAMLAGLVMNEVERGVSAEHYGLTRAKAETLAGRLAEAIVAEHGGRADDVRAAYKADFEDFAGQRFVMDNASAAALFAAEMARCRPLFDSIEVGAGDDGIVRALAPVASMPGPDQCYAMLSAMATGMPKRGRERKEFDAMIARLERRVLGGAARTSAEGKARLAAAVARFDADAFDALDEPQGEARMTHCFALAA